MAIAVRHGAWRSRAEESAEALRTCSIRQQLDRALQQLTHLRGVLAGAAREVGLAAAFAADDRCELAEQFAGGEFCREFGRRRGDEQRDVAALNADADEHGNAAEATGFQRVVQRRQQLGVTAFAEQYFLDQPRHRCVCIDLRHQLRRQRAGLAFQRSRALLFLCFVQFRQARF